MSIKALSDYIVYSKYAKYKPEKLRRETWPEQVNRVFDMHERKYKEFMSNPRFRELFDIGKRAVLKKRVLGSQRALQYGGPGIEKHNDKIYNCAVTYLDRPEAFSQVMYMLLCGCGVGFSVQYPHVSKLPSVKAVKKSTVTYVIEDSIEGWANSIDALMMSYFNGSESVIFDYSLIRPEGELIANSFIAPGPEGLKTAHEKIKKVIEKRLEGKDSTDLHPIDYYDIIMHSSDAVLSGGVRRSATICLFSLEDDEMMNAKIGDWFYTNPQRGRSNNSVVLLRDQITKEKFNDIVLNSVKEFGEPGFVWSDDPDILYNPCVEIGFYPKTKDGKSGVQYCNLTEINGKKCTTKEAFLEACLASAVIGTLQAGYTDFAYLGKTTEEIVKTEALLGCSITGLMDNPEILFDPEIQKEGARLIKKINKELSKIIGINQAARCTCVKPAGTTSCVLETASGIHAHHSRRYIRNIQANKLEFPAQEYARHNPLEVRESVWNPGGNDVFISFLCDVPLGSITKNMLSAEDMLEKVKLTQQNWVREGTNRHLCTHPTVTHNVSNTIVIKENEWESTADYIYKNRKWFAGISLLADSGDKDYRQAPFVSVLTAKELAKKYGDASVFASGLIVDGLHAFNDLWLACDHVLITKTGEPVLKLSEENEAKADWIRRANQFAKRYFDNDVREMTYCLKDVHYWKRWCDIRREHTDIDWSKVIEKNEYFVNANTLGAQACAGGKCDL